MTKTKVDGLTVRPSESPEDVDRAASLLASPGIREIAEAQKDEPGSIRLLEREGEVVGALVHRRETWDVGAAELRVARVWECTGEAGASAFRLTGDRRVFDTLVADWCDHLRAEGYHLAYTHGELALWPVHGFFPCFYHPRVYIPTAKALRLKKVYDVRSVKTADAKPMLRMMERNRHLRPRVFAAGVPHFHHYAVEGPGGRVYGYFSLAVSDGNGQPPVFIPEVEVLNREAAETILAHTAPFAKEKGMRALHFPLAAEHPFAAVCLDLGGYFQIRGTTRDITLDEEMVRVVDSKACMSALEPELARRLERAGHVDLAEELVLDIEGETVPLRLDAEGLRVVKRVERGRAVKLPRWVFTQLVMGYRDLRILRRLAIRPASLLDLLCTVFPVTWPLSLCDHDLWDPALRDPKKYSAAAMKEIRKLRYPF